jgi:hypothetical protein
VGNDADVAFAESQNTGYFLDAALFEPQKFDHAPLGR